MLLSAKVFSRYLIIFGSAFLGSILKISSILLLSYLYEMLLNYNLLTSVIYQDVRIQAISINTILNILGVICMILCYNLCGLINKNHNLNKSIYNICQKDVIPALSGGFTTFTSWIQDVNNIYTMIIVKHSLVLSLTICTIYIILLMMLPLIVCLVLLKTHDD